MDTYLDFYDFFFRLLPPSINNSSSIPSCVCLILEFGGLEYCVILHIQYPSSTNSSMARVPHNCSPPYSSSVNSGMVNTLLRPCF